MRRFLSAPIALLLFAVAFPESAFAGSIVNGGFEVPHLMGGTQYITFGAGRAYRLWLERHRRKRERGRGWWNLHHCICGNSMARPGRRHRWYDPAILCYHAWHRLFVEFRLCQQSCRRHSTRHCDSKPIQTENNEHLLTPFTISHSTSSAL